MDSLPFEVRFDLAGWALYGALLESTEHDGEGLVLLRAEAVEQTRARWRLETLSSAPVVVALRRLFRAAGCDPTRYRPSSEALLRRVLKGEALPAISPLVDLNNVLSLSLAVPCCVMVEDAVAPPFVLRAGESDETYESLRGPFKLAGKPLLVDRQGPCDTPITGSQRVKVNRTSRRAWLIAYLPADVVKPQDAESALHTFLQQAPVARVVCTGGAAAESTV